MSRRTLSRLLLVLGAAATAWIGLAPKVDVISRWDHFHKTVILALAVALGCQVAVYLLKAVTKRQAVKAFLDYLHRRCWGRDGGKNPNFRVSFWVPGMGIRFWKGRRLFCYHRTDGRRTSKAWGMKPPAEDSRDGHGPVGMIWMTEMSPKVKGIGPDAADQHVEVYLQETCMTRAEYDQLSWKGAAVTGTILRFSHDGDAIGVLLVECRLKGAEIEPTEIVHDPGIFSMIWEGRL